MEPLTFLFTDIEGSTSLLERVGGDVFSRVLSTHHQLIRGAISDHGGEEIDTAGDGFFVVFPSARECAAAVIEMQRGLQACGWPDGQTVRVRMGVHSGEASRTATGLVGMDVHRAARVAGVAPGGQILLSETTAALVRDELSEHAEIRDLGPHRLKDLGRPRQIFQLSAQGLMAEFPPLRSLDNPQLANNLPAQTASFVGRGTELAAVRALVDASRLVTLTGAGGAGKTRLALQVAAELLDGSGDGVWLVELAGVTDPAEVPDRVRETLGIAAQPGRSAEDAILDALAPQNLLIVLDNCEHLIEACADLTAAILRRGPQVHIVATSREPLGIDGEAIYRVPSLSVGSGTDPVAGEGSDAVLLFIERARAQGVELGVDAGATDLIRSICDRLDGMPLAIELAVARLRSLSLQALSERLDQRFRLLTGGSRTALPRQRTLEATVQWSYSLLNAEEQMLLRRLSVFVDGFDLGAAEAVCGLEDIEVWDIADLLGSLVDKSLVMTSPARTGLRYRLLETIRQFAGDRLIEGDPAELMALAGAHCRYYLALAETLAPGLVGREPVATAASIDLERANLRRAMEFAAADPAWMPEFLRFPRALYRYWYLTASVEAAEWLGVVETPEARAHGRDYVLGSAALLAAAAVSDAPRAALRAEALVTVSRELGDRAALAQALLIVAQTRFFCGELEAGIVAVTEATEIARALGDDLLLSDGLMFAHMAVADRDYAAGEPLLREGLALAERTGHVFVKALMLNNAGVMALTAGDIPAAREHLLRAWEDREMMGARQLILAESVSSIRRIDGDYAEAASLLLEVIIGARRAGDAYVLSYTTLGLALLASDQDQFDRALALHGLAQVMARHAGHQWLIGYDRWREDSLERVRAALGDAAVEQARQQADDIGYEDAVERVMEAARRAVSD